MLSIRFIHQPEWWVSGETFDRLFKAGLEAETIPRRLERWWHAANANGGLSLSLLERHEADELAQALYETARQELISIDTQDADRAYREGLLKLLEAK